MVHLCFHSTGYSSPPSLFIFSFFLQRGLSGNVCFSVRWWAARAPGPGLAPDSVCAVKASTSHEGPFLSTAEDSEKHKTSQSPILYSNQTTHMPNI